MLNWIKRIIIEHTLPFKEIEYFHPHGNKMPNGSYYQRGGFCKECRENEESFLVYNDQGRNIAHNKGFIIVFPTNTNITLSSDKYYSGHFFEGKYIGADKIQYDRRSTCIFIDDKSLVQSLRYAMNIASENNSHHVIVKDIETSKIYRGCI